MAHGLVGGHGKHRLMIDFLGVGFRVLRQMLVAKLITILPQAILTQEHLTPILLRLDSEYTSGTGLKSPEAQVFLLVME